MAALFVTYHLPVGPHVLSLENHRLTRCRHLGRSLCPAKHRSRGNLRILYHEFLRKTAVHSGRHVFAYRLNRRRNSGKETALESALLLGASGKADRHHRSKSGIRKSVRHSRLIYNHLN